VTARTFADARDGEIIVYEDAYENIAIAISGGSAAGTFFSAQPGVDVRIRLAD
jgi:S-adenosylmethionine hydrolase